jgi:hypothetical protein
MCRTTALRSAPWPLLALGNARHLSLVIVFDISAPQPTSATFISWSRQVALTV